MADVKQVLENKKCVVEFRVDRKEIFGQDKTDANNMPAFYNKNKRGLAKAFARLQKVFNENMSMYDCMGVLCAEGIRCHSWCMMD